jgi:hypothetical protein
MQAVRRAWVIGVRSCSWEDGLPLLLPKLSVLGVGLALGVVLSGCPSGTGSKVAPKADAGFGSTEDAGVYCPPEALTSQTFMINIESSGKQITARLSDAKPSPPERHTNVWTIDLLDASGNPIEDAKITKAYAQMPYHNHGKPAYSVKKMPEPGRFEVGLNFFMPGDFQVQLTVASASAGNDFITFEYCVE